MKLIIAGSRTAPAYLKNRIPDLIEAMGWVVTEVVSGGCRGPDRWGEEWAEEHGIPCKIFEADWSGLGKAAGMIRNREMAEYADAALLFWDFESKGTKNMMEEMKKRNKPFSICGFGVKPA